MAFYRGGRPPEARDIKDSIPGEYGDSVRPGGSYRKSFTDFLRCVAKHDSHALERHYGSGYSQAPRSVAKTAMGESSGTAGGYIVPPDYSMKLMNTIAEESFIYPRATVIPMMSAETTAPKVDVETVQTAGTSPFFGGVKFAWGSEQAPKETEPAFRGLSLKAWDLLGYVVMSNQWLSDSGPAGEEYLLKLLGRAAAWYMEYAFLQGLGADQLMPLGVINAPCAIKVNRKTGSTISAQDLAELSAALLPFGWTHAIWVTGPDCLSPIQQLTQYFINVELGDLHHAHPRPAGVLMTRPLYVTEKLPALGTYGDLVLFDPSLYTIGMRQEVLIDASPHTLFQTYQTVFRVWLRLDGKPQVSNKITLQDGTRTVSPVVVLN